ncbi:hypothetical protein GCM10023206_06850 [Acinetobacter puyangensis]|uniref:Uncharacterized protein n=1 Tax=Acinetobacter puyangensis TaxID=1096779 RepID=A0A240E6N4_9GAMM|nr:hypothetical protein [Acinetobacter puyangensis]SNX44236.1 hypothetical protein SAMN05421731_102397 [Acinetobacter puyangensis]
MRQTNPVLLSQLRQDYESIQAIGAPLLASQGMLVFEDSSISLMRYHIKSSMRPIVSNGDPAEVQYAGGLTGIVAGVPNTKYTGNIQIIATESGYEQELAEYVVNTLGGIIEQATYYDGRMDSYTRAYSLHNLALRFEPGEFDSESRSQVMTISCPCDYNYFGLYADIGSNGTVSVGQKTAAATSFSNTVQSTIRATQAALSSVGQIANAANTLGSLFG